MSQGSLTKVQAAQYLNRFRIQQVGRNSVDDSMYEVYLRSAVDSQRGELLPSNPNSTSKVLCAVGNNVGKTWIPSQVILRLPTS